MSASYPVLPNCILAWYYSHGMSWISSISSNYIQAQELFVPMVGLILNDDKENLNRRGRIMLMKMITINSPSFSHRFKWCFTQCCWDGKKHYGLTCWRDRELHSQNSYLVVNHDILLLGSQQKDQWACLIHHLHSRVTASYGEMRGLDLWCAYGALLAGYKERERYKNCCDGEDLRSPIDSPSKEVEGCLSCTSYPSVAKSLEVTKCSSRRMRWLFSQK